MEDAILSLPKQFDWEPAVENAHQLGHEVSKFIVAGMGGSHLAAGLFKLANPKLDLLIHRDYGLPRVPDYFLQESLIIASSYSGNTEETIDAFKTAHEAGLKTAVITTGGTLLELAKAAGVPYIQLPKTGIQPRSALGYFVNTLAVLLGEETIKPKVDPEAWRAAGEELAKKLQGKTPIIYSSTANLALAYNWKIKFNETGKVPAFYNVFPELNHNELEGFDNLDTKCPSGHEVSKFGVVILHDEDDQHRIQLRMDIAADLLANRGLTVEVLEVAGETTWQKIFNTLLLADWTAVYLAKQSGTDPEAVPLIEEFKKLLNN